MDDLKCKKGNRTKELVIKKRKKVRRKTREKPKENGRLERATNSLEQLLSQISKPGVRKGLGRLRVKGRQKLEGMFSKGLRSEYITREALNEHNEARKNEDLNKIIDLGRDLLRKVEKPVRCTKRITRCPDNRKPKKSSDDLREVSTDGIENFEQCSLSPISLAESAQYEEAFETKRLNLRKEFERFALSYEEAVDAQILLRLPRGGVLQDALMALRKTGERERGKSLEEETTFPGELKFVREEPEREMPGAEDFIGNFAFPKKFPTPETHYYDAFNEKPLGNLLIMTDVKAEDYPSFTPPFYNDEEKDPVDCFSFGKAFKTCVRDFTIVTPPIRFYRRNMF